MWRAARHKKQIKTSDNWKEPPVNNSGSHGRFKTPQYVLGEQESRAKAVQKVSESC